MNDEVKELEPDCALGGSEADPEMRKAEGEAVLSSASAAESASEAAEFGSEERSGSPPR